MKLSIRFLFLLNILVELIAPPILLYLFLSLNVHEAISIATPVVIFIFLLFYTVYAPVIINVNKRRFPRRNIKASVVLLAPFLAALAFWFILLRDAEYISSVTKISVVLTILLLHFVSAMILSVVIELLQKQRVKVLIVPVFVNLIWILFAFLLSVFMSFVGILHVVFFLDQDSRLGTSSTELISYVSLWLVLMSAIAFVKYYRGGRTLYAKKGYRPNAAIIVTDGEGMVLLCERSDRPGTIQTVQGGIDPGEKPEQAAVRELGEELGIWPDQFELRAMLLDSKSYEWEEAVKRRLKRTGYVGQQQYFFLAEVSKDVEFDLDFHHREFRKVWWGSPEQLLRLSWSKKRPGIEAALKGFGLL